MTASPNNSSDEGWIEWNGGECPVPAGTRVQTRFRPFRGDRHEEAQGYGLVSKPTSKASSLRWNHENLAGDIIAYRVVQS